MSHSRRRTAATCWHRHPEAELRTLGVTIYRTLAHLTGTSEAEVKRLVRGRYTKVAEYQARGAVHFHAVIA